jgi:hypothetical protein
MSVLQRRWNVILRTEWLEGVPTRRRVVGGGGECDARRVIQMKMHMILSLSLLDLSLSSFFSFSLFTETSCTQLLLPRG